LVLTKKWSDSISASLILVTSQTFVKCLLSTNIYDLSGYIFCCQVITRWPCECPYVDTLFLSQLNPFPVQNLPSFFHYQLFHCEDCALYMPNINRPAHCIYNPLGRVAQLYLQALGTHFSHILWPAWTAVGLFFSHSPCGDLFSLHASSRIQVCTEKTQFYPLWISACSVLDMRDFCSSFLVKMSVNYASFSSQEVFTKH